jgi:hypothetical protein
MSPRPFAARTEVPAMRSRLELEELLERHGATGFAYAMVHGRAVVAFDLAGRRIRVELQLPDPAAPDFTHARHRSGHLVERPGAEAVKRHQQAVRQRWRALLLVVRAKLEAVAAGIVSFEDEFLAYVVLPGGSTVSQEIRPRLAEAYRLGRTPPLLPDLSGNGGRNGHAVA